MTKTIFKYSTILLIGLLFEWWIVRYSPLNLPERIPATPIKIDGLLLVGLLLTVLIYAEKQFLKSEPKTTIGTLTAFGTAICFVAEIIFQTIRQPFLSADTLYEHLYYFFLGTIGITLFGGVFSFLIAFQLIQKNTGKLILLIIAFITIVNIAKYIFPIPGQ